AWNPSVVDFFTVSGKTYGLPLMEGSRASMFYNKTMFKEAGIATPPSTFPELVADARKLVKFDASGKMIRSGISLRLSGQGSGIEQKNTEREYGVAPIPRWKAGGPYKMLLQPWAIYVNGKSSNQGAAWDFLKFLTNADNSVKLTAMTGWVSERQNVNWKPLLEKTPQFQVFVSPPKEIVFYVEPILSVFDEIESKLADHLPGAYIDATLKDNPGKVAETIHRWAGETDALLKGAGLYGTT